MEFYVYEVFRRDALVVSEHIAADEEALLTYMEEDLSALAEGEQAQGEPVCVPLASRSGHVCFLLRGVPYRVELTRYPVRWLSGSRSALAAPGQTGCPA